MIVSPVAPGGTEPFAPPRAAPDADTARAFEAMVLRPMLDAMVPEGGAFGEDTGASAWRGMMIDAVANAVAETAPLGLHAMLPASVAE